MYKQIPATLEIRQPPSPPRRPSWRPWFWLFGAVMLCVAAYYAEPGLKRTQPGKTLPANAGPKTRGPNTIPVVAARSQKGAIDVYFTGLGVVTPINTVTVKSRVDGQLMKVLYSEGQTVHQGDLLVEIDPRPYQVQLTQAEGQRIKDQAALDNARIDLARYQKLWSQNAIPQQQLATQQVLVTQYEGAVKTDQGQIDSANLNLAYCHISAPITGRVGLRLVDPGNIVHAADNNGLLVITQLDPISVIFTVAEDQVPAVLSRIRTGRRLKVEAWNRDLKTRIAQGSLMTIDNQIDQTTGTLKLRAVFDNKHDALFPDQFVNARLLVEEKRGVILAPNAAVQRNSQATSLYVVKPDGTVAVRSVTVGVTEGDQSEIASGLSPGEVVVTEGVDKLQEGSKVIAHTSEDRTRKARQ